MITSTLLMLLLGFSVGAFGTLIGVGGGFILVPLFLLAFHWSPQHAVGTSLTIVLMNAVSGTFAYIRQRKVYYDAAIRFSLATLPGAFIGSYLAQYFTSDSFRITFGVFLVGIAALMYFRSSAKQGNISFDEKTFSYNRPLGIGISVVVGFLSSILGIGGGIIHVPAMVYVLGFPAHVATATSHFVLAISAFSGVISHYALGNILLEPALTIGVGAVLGAQFGARLSLKVKSPMILKLLAVALLILGVRLVLIAV
ncbi:MAG TPA: sulfite exporter TauE/SafE family protein [Patescibacteria group bacterium]|nr:sulfite exporter TauE/SafE family protein [Patescibacteria group bacterium]